MQASFGSGRLECPSGLLTNTINRNMHDPAEAPVPLRMQLVEPSTVVEQRQVQGIETGISSQIGVCYESSPPPSLR